jgi:KUP system potassium uptake protein
MNSPGAPGEIEAEFLFDPRVVGSLLTADRKFMSSSNPPTQALSTEEHRHGHGLHKLSTSTLVLSALGVVFGDIGTSPLYAVKECFSPESAHRIPVSESNILGIISLVLWSLIVLVCLKYAIFVLRADNKGEGGLLSMMSLALTRESTGRSVGMIIILGIFGSALLFGDGMITPAISVLSAVEGLKEANVFGKLPLEAVAKAAAEARIENIMILITCVVIVALFSMQFLGTDKVGKFFGPITLVWFAALGVMGANNLWSAPHILAAFNPMHGLNFLMHGGWHHFLMLGSVVLCVTGCEAMYADMGHFGARPIRLGWFYLVLPALALNYLGQGALLLQHPEAAISPFFKGAPAFLLLPLIGLATAATVIASQALISGTYSLTLSAIQMGYLPRTTIRHTSEHARGQIYIPLVNWLLMLVCIVLVVVFRKSTNLASAYGVGVTMTMMVTSLLLGFVAVRRWQWRGWVAISLSVFLFLFEGAFLVANSPKFLDGGWFPVAIALALFTLMTTWKRGRQLVGQKLDASGLSHELFIESLMRRSPDRVSGTAIFMTSSQGRTPVAMLHNLKHNKVIHQRVCFMTLMVEDTPYVLPSKRVEVEDLGSGFWRITGHYGFMQKPNVPRLLRRCKHLGLDVSAEESTFFLGREIIVPSDIPGMAKWREHLFGFASKIAQQPATYFQIPIGRVIELGQQVEI